MSDGFEELTVFKVYEDSRNDPDNGPKKPPREGMWTWWRTGEHPQGVWVALDWKNGTETSLAYAANEKAHPVPQDAALGESSDFGYQVCHACGAMNEGYPEPRHATECDGVCKHGANGGQCSLHLTRARQRRYKERRDAENAEWAAHDADIKRPVAERIADGSLDTELATIYYALLERYTALRTGLPDEQ